MTTLDMDWREIDRNLRSIAARRAALDAEEARWLREAERLEVWRPLGMVSALDYMERVLGYTPHAAAERLRVARELADLPQLEAALDGGELAFSAVRELTRVATPETEGAWCERAQGKNMRQVEELVAGHARGDHPDDPSNPDLRMHDARFRLVAEAYARLRQVQAMLAEEHGRRLDDSELVIAMCDAVLDREAANGNAAEPVTGRAKFQVMMTICKHCERGWQEGSGVRVPVDAAAVERARCDAQHIGSTDDDAPVRAEQDIPPSVVRFVWHRDGGRCTTPGCRSARGLEIHHRIPRSAGGSHDPSNLGLQCSACHMAIHRNTLVIAGDVAHRPNAVSDGANADSSRVAPPRATVARTSTSSSHVGPDASLSPSAMTARATPSHAERASRLDAAIIRTQARDALVTLGWKPAVARTAVEDAVGAGCDGPLESLIREALPRCPLRSVS